MSQATHAPPADRVATRLRSAILAGCLATILFGAYGLVLPIGWPHAKLSIMIAAAVGLALTIVWLSPRTPAGDRSADDVALMFALASTVLGLGGVTLFAYGLTLRLSQRGMSPQTLIYQLTSSSALLMFAALALPAALTGGLARGIARRRDRAVDRASLAGSAARFSTVGLLSAALIALTVAAAAVYRWLMWG